MCVHEQEQRAQQAALRGEEALHASYGQMRKAERKAKEAAHRAEELKWRIEGGGVRPRTLRSNRTGRWRRSEYGPHPLGHHSRPGLLRSGELL